MCIIPVFVSVFFIDWQWARLLATALFCVAAITDWLDGYLARKLQQSSPFGAFLDPVADKLIVAAALILVTHMYSSIWVTVSSVVLLCREIYISALREWMAKIGASDSVKVGYIGKLKTTVQMIALIGMLSGLEYFLGIRIYFETLGLIFLYISAILSIWSMIEYTSAAWKNIAK